MQSYETVDDKTIESDIISSLNQLKNDIREYISRSYKIFSSKKK